MTGEQNIKPKTASWMRLFFLLAILVLSISAFFVTKNELNNDTSNNLGALIGGTTYSASQPAIGAPYPVFGWSKSVGDPLCPDYGTKIIANNGQIYSTGYREQSLKELLNNPNAGSGCNGYDVWISDYTSGGSVGWAVNFPSFQSQYINRGYDIARDSSGNIYVIGDTNVYTTEASGGSSTDMMILKYSAAGLFICKEHYGTASSDSGWGISVDSQNNVYAVGSAGGSMKLWKFNGCNMVWQKSASGATALDIATDSSGNIYTVVNSAFYSQYLVKFNSSGDEINRIAIPNALTLAADIKIDPQNNIYIVTQPPVSPGGIYLLKYDTNLNLIWSKNDGVQPNVGSSLALDSLGNIYVTGFQLVNYKKDFILTKFNPDSNIVWSVLEGTPTANEIGGGVAVDSDNSIYTTGSEEDSSPTYHFPNIWLQKFNEISAPTSGGDNWVYQNAPGTTAWQNKIVLNLGLTSGSVVVTQDITSSLGKVNIQRSATNPLIWEIVGGQYGVDPVGNAKIIITITDTNGNVYKTQTNVAVRLLGDVNGDGNVDASDKLLMAQAQAHLTVPYPKRNFDLNGDGNVDATDKLIMAKLQAHQTLQ